MKNNFYNKHYISVEGLTKNDVEYFFKKAEMMRTLVKKKGSGNSLKGKVLTALFYEPSTRTFSSFTAAMEKLGGSVIPNRDITSTSVVKGETLKDTIRTLSKLSDIIVLRHPDVDSAKIAASVSSVPVINGGDGATGEHPTHALHDLWTIRQKFGKLDGLHIVMVGDLLHYRNVTSLAKLLAMYKVRITFVSAKVCVISDSLRTYLKRGSCTINETENLSKPLTSADTLYVTRVKKEYMSKKLYAKLRKKYVVDGSLVATMKKNSIIMHPLPRVDELSESVDSDHRAIYLTTQLENALYGKMAILEAILKK